jgi:hypothetical protein
MIRIIIDDKIDQKLIDAGEQVQIEYRTDFNETITIKNYPEDYTDVEKILIRDIYNHTICNNEIGNKVYEPTNNGKVIKINGYTRIAADGEPQSPFGNEDTITLEFMSHGIECKCAKISGNYNQPFTLEDTLAVQEIGIIISGTFADFNIDDHNNDMSLDVLKGRKDSYIDSGDFKDGKIIFRK